MLDKLLHVLEFLRIVDEDHKISLTNLAVYITLAKLVAAPNVIAPTDLGAVLAALASYQAKRWIRATPSTGEDSAS